MRLLQSREDSALGHVCLFAALLWPPKPPSRNPDEGQKLTDGHTLTYPIPG